MVEDPATNPAPEAAPVSPPVPAKKPMIKVGTLEIAKKTLLEFGITAGAMIFMLFYVLHEGDASVEAPVVLVERPVRPDPGTLGPTTSKRQGPSLLDVLPEGTLASVWGHDLGKLLQRGKDLGCWRWLKKTGLRDLAEKGWEGAALDSRNQVRAELPERLADIDPLTQGCLDFMEFPIERLTRAGMIFPGEMVIGIVGFNNKGNILPVPHILLVADITPDINEAWMDSRLDRLLNYFNAQDSNSAFTVSRVRNNEDDLDVTYFRFGDKASSFSVGLWKKRLILSNDDLVFRKALRAVQDLGSKKKPEDEGVGPRRLVDTITWRQAALKLDPQADDIHVYIQNQMVGKLISSTLPVDSPLMKLDDMLGIQQCQAMVASVKLEGYAIRERLAFVYSGGMPEESLLTFLNRLPQGQKLSACAPVSAVAILDFHIDLNAAWNACRRFDNNIRSNAKATDFESLIEVLELGYNLYPEKIFKDFDTEKLLYASRDGGRLNLGGLLTLKPNASAHVKLLTAPALHALGTRWKGQVEVERLPLEGHPAISLKFLATPEIMGSALANTSNSLLSGMLSSQGGLLREIHACLTETHLAFATSRDELEELVKRIPLSRKSTPATACPPLLEAMSRFENPCQSLIWLDTRRMVSALQRKAPSVMASLPFHGFSLQPTAFEELATLMPPIVAQVHIMDPLKRKAPPGSIASPTGVYVESFGPIPLVTPLFLTWALEKRLGVIFGPGEPQKP